MRKCSTSYHDVKAKNLKPGDRIYIHGHYTVKDVNTNDLGGYVIRMKRRYAGKKLRMVLIVDKAQTFHVNRPAK